MKRLTVFLFVMLFAGTASAWCLPGYTEAQDQCHPGLVYCLASGQKAPTTCDGQKQQQKQNQDQSQGQDQNQGQSQLSLSNATGGKGGAGGAGGAGGQGGQGTGTASASVTATTGASTSGVSDSGNGGGASIGAQTTTTNDYAAKIPVNTAIAPTVITGSDQCLVPVSGSVQAVAIGVAMGSAVPDRNCEALKLSDRLKYLGQYAAAVEILAIQDPRVRDAIKNVGGYVPVADAARVRPMLKHNEYDGRDLVNVQVPAASPSLNIGPQR